MVEPSSRLISDTRRPVRSRPTTSRIIFASSSSEDCDASGIECSLACLAACLPERPPKTSVSSSELAPSRLPPCTETQATSPAAYRPGIGVRPSESVFTPPMT